VTLPLPALAGTPPLIAYGADKASASANFPRVPLHPGELLRLSSEHFDLPAPAIGQESVPVDIRLADHLKRLSGGWSRAASLFIDGYFAHLREVIAAHQAEIAARLAPMAGLFAPEDVLYSAPLPLPRALLPLANDEGGADQVPVDVLFWLGDEAKAVLFAPSPLTPGAERRRRERLESAGIDLRVLTARDLENGETYAALLGEKGGAFWRDEVLPIAPGAPRLPAF
jgi:hypothetical protein